MWQYKVRVLSEGTGHGVCFTGHYEILNLEGQEGWELIAVTPRDSTIGSDSIISYHFKRWTVDD